MKKQPFKQFRKWSDDRPDIAINSMKTIIHKLSKLNKEKVTRQNIGGVLQYEVYKLLTEK